MISRYTASPTPDYKAVSSLNKFKNDFLTAIILNTPDANGTTLISERKRLMVGDNSVPMKLARLRSEPAYKDNPLFQALVPILDTVREDIHNIKPYVDKDPLASNAVTYAWEQLYLQDKEFAMDLMKFCLLQSGLQMSPLNYIDIIPASIYRDYIKPMLDSYQERGYGVMREAFLYAWQLSNYNDDSILPFNLRMALEFPLGKRYATDEDGNKTKKIYPIVRFYNEKKQDIEGSRINFPLDSQSVAKNHQRQIYNFEAGSPLVKLINEIRKIREVNLDESSEFYEAEQTSSNSSEKIKRAYSVAKYTGDITPGANTIFVFGSNPEGKHGARAAKVARKLFGAIYGQGEGLQGNAYALPTKDLRVKRNNSLRSIPPEQIIENIKKLYETARQNPDKQFKVAYRNTDKPSLSGYTGLEMIDMFLKAGSIPTNMVFSEEWVNTGKFNLDESSNSSEQNNNAPQVASPKILLDPLSNNLLDYAGNVSDRIVAEFANKIIQIDSAEGAIDEIIFARKGEDGAPFTISWDVGREVTNLFERKPEFRERAKNVLLNYFKAHPEEEISTDPHMPNELGAALIYMTKILLKEKLSKVEANKGAEFIQSGEERKKLCK